MFKHLLVTGGTGFLGEALVESLAKDGMAVTYTYRGTPLAITTARGIQIDLTNKDAYTVYPELQDVDCLVHTAAKVNASISDDTYENISDHLVANLQIINNIFAALPNLKKVVFVSSIWAEAYMQEPTFYGMGKHFVEETLEHIARLKKISYTALRFPQLYGPNESHGIFVTKFIDAVLAGEPIKLINKGNAIRDILYIQDAIGSIHAAIDSPRQGAFTITESTTYTVGDILEATIKVANPTYHNIEHITDQASPVGPQGTHFSSTADKLGYTLQYPLEQGLQETIKQRRK